MDEATRTELRSLVEACDAAAEGISGTAEADAATALVDYVREVVDAEPPTLPTPGATWRELVDAYHATAGGNYQEEVDAALALANYVSTLGGNGEVATLSVRPPLSTVTVATLALIVQAGQKGFGVRRLGDDGHVMAGIARGLVKGPDDLTFPSEDTDVRDTYLWVTMGVTEVAWPVSELVEGFRLGTFVV